MVDDHVLFRESAVAFLKAQKDMEVVGQCSTAPEAKPRLAVSKPDIVLMEVKLPGQGAFDLLRDVPTLSPNSRMIALSETEV